ncbi:MAG: hypothetical protein ACRC0X_02290 [Brevinema sp.]
MLLVKTSKTLESVVKKIKEWIKSQYEDYTIEQIMEEFDLELYEAITIVNTHIFGKVSKKQKNTVLHYEINTIESKGFFWKINNTFLITKNSCKIFGTPRVGMWFAPIRVNVIGDIIFYSSYCISVQTKKDMVKFYPIVKISTDILTVFEKHKEVDKALNHAIQYYGLDEELVQVIFNDPMNDEFKERINQLIKPYKKALKILQQTIKERIKYRNELQVINAKLKKVDNLTIKNELENKKYKYKQKLIEIRCHIEKQKILCKEYKRKVLS